MKQKLVKGTRYWAKLELGMLESFASNEQVAEKFTELGFTEVKATGSDDARVVKGIWNKESTTVEVPAQVTDFGIEYLS